MSYDIARLTTHVNDPPSIGSFANDRTPNYGANLGHSRNTAFRLEYETRAKEPFAKNDPLVRGSLVREDNKSVT